MREALLLLIFIATASTAASVSSFKWNAGTTSPLEAYQAFIRPSPVGGMCHATSTRTSASQSRSVCFGGNKIYETPGVSELLNAKPFSLPRLPWDPEKLSPYFSDETIEFHYGKHHANYVRQLNAIASQDPSIGGKSLEEIVRTENGAVYNNAAQIWNHNFFWNSISPSGGGPPHGPIAGKIFETFGSFNTFKDQFTDAAKNHFGSGWVWLVEGWNGNLSIETGHDADNPIRVNSGKPLLTIDVWEHAYYIDFRNSRADYIEAWFNVVNWENANQKLLQDEEEEGT